MSIFQPLTQFIGLHGSPMKPFQAFALIAWLVLYTVAFSNNSLENQLHKIEVQILFSRYRGYMSITYSTMDFTVCRMFKYLASSKS